MGSVKRVATSTPTITAARVIRASSISGVNLRRTVIVHTKTSLKSFAHTSDIVRLISVKRFDHVLVRRAGCKRAAYIPAPLYSCDFPYKSNLMG